MATVSTEDPQFQLAIQACTVALRRMADYELEPSLHRRMQALGVVQSHVTAMGRPLSVVRTAPIRNRGDHPTRTSHGGTVADGPS
jgi:hypothetical protein